MAQQRFAQALCVCERVVCERECVYVRVCVCESLSECMCERGRVESVCV